MAEAGGRDLSDPDGGDRSIVSTIGEPAVTIEESLPRLSIEDVALTLRAYRLQVDLSCDRWPLVLLGPSGAGKTILLRILAGLEIPETGRIAFGDEVWLEAAGLSRPQRSLVATHRRSIGYCIQNALLFPHLTVVENVEYPLSNLKPHLSRTERKVRAMEELSRWGAAHLAAARPAGLSGGEQSRVALARAFVRKPKLLLLDEPFAALDPPSRETLLSAVLSELRERKTPAVWVTHDRNEAVSLGGTLAVILEGRVAQVGAPEDVFRRPGGAAVAAFVGVGTVLHGLVQAREGGVMRIRCGPVLLRAGGNLPPGMAVVATIRSEEIELTLPDADSMAGRTSARNEIPAEVVSIRSLGLNYLVELDAGIPLAAAVTRPALEELDLRPGRRVLARIKALAVQVHSEAWKG